MLVPLTALAASDVTDLSLEQLMQQTVVGASKYEQKQSEVAAAVSVITRQEIQAFGWRTLDQALASLPGVYTTYDRQYSYVGTRGFSVPGDFNTRFLLTINGNRVNDAVYDQAYVGRDFPLDLDLIERIEFIPGPGGAVYGQNAMFGVVNVVTRSGAQLGGTELEAAYTNPQSRREGRASWGGVLDNGIDVLLSASGMHSRGEDLFYDYGASGVSGVAVGMDGEHNQQFYGHAARGPWSLEFVYGDRLKNDPTGAYQSDPLVPGSYQRDRMPLAQAQYHDNFADDTVELSGRLFAGRESYSAPDVFGGQRTLQSADSAWHGLELRALLTTLKQHKVLLGLEYQANIRQNQAFDKLTATPGLVDVVVPRSGERTGVFVQDEWAVSSALSATLGVRLDHNNVTGNEFTPRAALLWQESSDTTLKALYGRAFRPPNVYEHDYGDNATQVANPTLSGETIDTVELVADHRVGRGLTLRASAYHWKMSDIVTLGTDPVSGLTQYQSGTTINARGLELSADKAWEYGTRLRGSLSFQDVTPEGGDQPLNSPKVLAKANLSTPLPVAGLRLGYELRYDSARRTLDGTELGGYAVSNAYLRDNALARGLEVSLGVTNLFDHSYAQPGSRNNWQNALRQDGRSVMVDLSYAF